MKYVVPDQQVLFKKKLHHLFVLAPELWLHPSHEEIKYGACLCRMQSMYITTCPVLPFVVWQLARSLAKAGIRHNYDALPHVLSQ